MPCPLRSGHKVAWTMFDGQTMAGTILGVWPDTYDVQRVDGGMCTVHQSQCRPATWQDIESAIAFFTHLHRTKEQTHV